MALLLEGFGQEYSGNDDRESRVKSQLDAEYRGQDHEHSMRQRNMRMMK
jgi:hypothetical protein